MYELAPNIEVLFTDSEDYSDRVRAAAEAGFTAVEMWGREGTTSLLAPRISGR